MINLMRRRHRPRYVQVLRRISIVAAIGSTVLGLMPIASSAAQSPLVITSLITTHALHPHSTGCSVAQYSVDIQRALPQRTDCGASISVPATLQAGACSTYKNPALCPQKFTIALKVPGATLCTAAEQPLGLAGGSPCVPPPLLYAYAYGSKGILYGTTLEPGPWCGSTGQYCDTAESVPQYLGVPTLGTYHYPSHFLLYVQVLIVGQFFAIAKINVSIGSSKPVTANWLSASIKFTTPSGGQLAANKVSPGTKLTATVQLSVSSSATGPVSVISVKPALAVSPSTVLNLEGGPSPPLPATLTIKPGSSFSYKLNYVVATPGTVVLSVKATGTGPHSSVQSATDSLTARLGQALLVSVNWRKGGKALSSVVNGKVIADTLQLADADAGEEPAYLSAEVVIKNDSTTAQENVALNGVPPFSFATKAQAVRVLPVHVTAGPSPQGPIGTLAPGAKAVVRFTVHVTNNGIFNFTPQVLSSTRGSNATNVSEAVSTLTVLPTKLLWLSLHPLETGLVNPGTPVLIGGTVTNRSLTQPLDLAPLVASVTGNANGGELIDQKAPAQPDGVVLPFAGELAPGETIDVIGEVGTSLVPGSRAEVTYEPTGTVANADGTTRAIKPDDVGVNKDSLPIPVHLNVADPPPPPSNLETIAGNFVDSTFFYTAKYSYVAFKGVGDVIAHPVDAVTTGVDGVRSVVVASGATIADAAQLQASVYLLATVGESWTPAQRQAFAEQVVADFKASHLKIAADKAQAVYAAVNHAAYDVFVPFQDALQTGNYNKVAALAGQGFGAGLTTVGDLVVSDVIFQKILIGLGQVPSALRSVPTLASNTSSAVIDVATNIRAGLKSAFAEDVTLASELKNAGVTQSLGKGLPGIVAGQDLLAQSGKALTDIYGLTKSQIAALQNFCATNEVIVAVRSRSKRAAQLIRDGLAVGKNEVLKIKNVSEIDTAYLGYSSADLNTIVWAEPVPLDFVNAQLRDNGAGALERDVVLARYDLRVEEWKNPKINKVIDDAEKSETIQWNLDGSGNGTNLLIEQRRSFALKKQPNPVSTKKWPTTKNRTYKQVTVGNKPLVNGKVVSGTRLVPVTQDVDLMAILAPNGEILSAERRAKVYEYLSNLIGIEHGETPSWILNGEMIFQAKAKILADAIPGGEALAVFAPTRSVTAGFYNPALTTFNNTDKTGRIFFEGGYNNAYYLWRAKLKTSLGNFANAL